MHRRNPRSIALWFSLFAYLLAGLVGAPGFVLCVGPSGHIAIETVAAGDCDGCLTSVASQEATPTQLEVCPKCPCDDVALPGAGVVVQKLDSSRSADVPLRALPVPVAFVDVALQVSVRASDRVSEAARVASTRPRSVVLLV